MTDLVRYEEKHLAPIPYSDIERMGMVLVKSQLFGIKTPEQAIALMLVAQSEGKHPATVAKEYDIIAGRPALKAQAMLARFQEDFRFLEGQGVEYAYALHKARDIMVAVVSFAEDKEEPVDFCGRIQAKHLGFNPAWTFLSFLLPSL